MSWTLQRQTLEIRYPNAYAYIDKTGSIAEAFCGTFPDFEMHEGTVSKCQLVNKKTGADVQYGLSRAAIGADMEFLPQKTFFEYCAFLFPRIFNECHVKSLTRVGHRISMHRKTESLKAAEESINQMMRRSGTGLRILHSGEEPRLQQRRVIEFAFRFEDEKLGYFIRSNGATSGVELQGPNVAHLQSRLPAATPVVVLDVDFYTKQPMSIETLLTEEFLRSNLKMAETRIIPLLES